MTQKRYPLFIHKLKVSKKEDKIHHITFYKADNDSNDNYQNKASPSDNEKDSTDYYPPNTEDYSNSSHNSRTPNSVLNKKDTHHDD